MEFYNLIYEPKDKCVLITINRPKKLNALNGDLIEELNHVLRYANEDDAVRAVVITGSGDKAFVAGADIKELSGFSEKEGEELARRGQALLFDFIENMSKPVIAAINGYTLGGGLELALACHIRVACDEAKFGFPEVSLGLIPGYGGTQRLPHIVGKSHAMDLILTARMLTAEEAYDISMINDVVSRELLLPKAFEIVEAIAKNAPNALAKAIEAINNSYNKRGYEVEKENFGKCFGTPDFKEGVDAFLNKRKPNF